MESFLTLLIPAALGFGALRLLMLPMKLMSRAAIHAAAGFLCLWLLNLVSGVTGIFFPINAVTVLIAGTLGLPGICGLAVIGMM